MRSIVLEWSHIWCIMHVLQTFKYEWEKNMRAFTRGTANFRHSSQLTGLVNNLGALLPHWKAPNLRSTYYIVFNV